MEDLRWQGFQFLPLVINDIIITSVLLLKVIYVLANFLEFIRDLTIY